MAPNPAGPGLCRMLGFVPHPNLPGLALADAFWLISLHVIQAAFDDLGNRKGVMCSDSFIRRSEGRAAPPGEIHRNPESPTRSAPQTDKWSRAKKSKIRASARILQREKEQRTKGQKALAMRKPMKLNASSVLILSRLADRRLHGLPNQPPPRTTRLPSTPLATQRCSLPS
uniref:Uncharacterized protein n=1 Tax=Candidatus Kentrum sp. DK TaxID=2126562 RepID=A0A450RU45_9GAMM|nr:MAG: hypothetical protein BECKDK2373C_GA0170839_100183 [Candidatus Kentron sp. DK]